MAVTITRRDMNVVGNLWEDVFEALTEASASDTSFTAVTRLHWVEHADVTCRTGESIVGARVSINSASASSTENDPGQITVSGINAGDTAATYYVRALGW